MDEWANVKLNDSVHWIEYRLSTALMQSKLKSTLNIWFRSILIGLCIELKVRAATYEQLWQLYKYDSWGYDALCAFSVFVTDAYISCN